MKELNHIELQNVIGGGASAGETYLNGIYGAVEGMTLCVSSGFLVSINKSLQKK